MPQLAQQETGPRRRGIDEQSDWIKEDEAAHELADALRRGVEAMRAHAEQYRFMKPNPGEMEMVEIGGAKSFSLYQLRIENSDLPNPWAESIRATARLPFRSRIITVGWDDELVGKTVADAKGLLVEHIPGWTDTLTAEGQSLDEYAAETFEDALFEGVVYSFVDNDPRTFPDPASRKAAGAQPRVTKFRRRDVRRITLETRHGVPRLKQIVLNQPKPTVDVSDPNAWVDECRPSRMVVTAGDPDADRKTNPDARKVRTQTYLQDDAGIWREDTSLRRQITPDNPLDELLDIPLVPHYSNRIGPYRGACPYRDSAWTQEIIWKINSWMVGLAREATLTHIHESGVMVDQKTGQPVLGDTRNARYHYSTEPAAQMAVHEMEGTALKSVRELLEWKIRLVEKAHHQIQTEKPTGPVTAREITLEGVHASSALEMWVLFQEQAWKRILDLMALLGGLPKRGVVSIPHDFGLPNTGMERNQHNFLGGFMSPVNYWNEAKRAGDVDERTFDFQAEVDWYEKQHGSGAGSTPPSAGGGADDSSEET